MEDMLWAGLTDSYAGTPMGITAENLATKYNITREVSVVLYNYLTVVLATCFCLIVFLSFFFLAVDMTGVR
jgi:hypothetical protein